MYDNEYNNDNNNNNAPCNDMGDIIFLFLNLFYRFYFFKHLKQHIYETDNTTSGQQCVDDKIRSQFGCNECEIKLKRQ